MIRLRVRLFLVRVDVESTNFWSDKLFLEKNDSGKKYSDRLRFSIGNFSVRMNFRSIISGVSLGRISICSIQVI